MSRFLSTDTVLFTILGYPMSYIELVGTLLYLWSVWLIARRNMLTWPVGIASVLLYLALFYQIQLYADAFEQVYYLGASVYGWWYWSRSRQETRLVAEVSYSTRGAAVLVAAATAILSVAFGAVTSRLHVWMPDAFPQAASYPYIDAGTTIMSFTAMWLMARKRIESWNYWIAVDLIGIWLYFVKDVRFVSLLYVILLVLAIKGLGEWRRAWARAPQLI
ncbi:MAG TPA: nicotinamide riboside transporter PnuC [Thermoanaerobaculia bacterium]|nr:nicotinamide riboside transporter PnuC [Thermoanaerobaculia bacterium]